MDCDPTRSDIREDTNENEKNGNCRTLSLRPPSAPPRIAHLVAIYLTGGEKPLKFYDRFCHSYRTGERARA